MEDPYQNINEDFQDTLTVDSYTEAQLDLDLQKEAVGSTWKLTLSFHEHTKKERIC